MYTIMLETDPIAVWSLVVAVASMLIALVAGGAAIRALKYAREAPTKEDLARVEGHAAASSATLARTEEYNVLTTKAERVTLKVSGGCFSGSPLRLRLWLTDDSVTLTSVQLLSKGISYGHFSCIRDGDGDKGLVFAATLEGTNASQWFNAGTPEGSLSHRLLVLKVYMSIGGKQEVSKEVPVHITDYLRVNEAERCQMPYYLVASAG